MRKNLIVTCILIAYIFIIEVMAGNVNRTRFADALKKGRASYFKEIKFNDFSKLNMGAKMSYISENFYGNMNVIPALIGGFFNNDVRVRSIVYTELSYLGVSKNKMLQSRKGKRILKRLQASLSALKETDSKAKYSLNRLNMMYAPGVPDAIATANWRALASMDLQQFRNSNFSGKTTAITSACMQGGKKGVRAFLVVLKAAVYKKGNLEVQKELVISLREAGLYAYNYNPKIKRRLAKIIKRVHRKARKELRVPLKQLADSMNDKPG